MCGITGILRSQGEVSEQEIKTITDCLQSRGPDAEGYFLKNNLALGHRRLSIIDLKSGDQPMYSEDRNVVISFNGEIYNYLDLKKELIKRGHHFQTTSDTEVLIIAYQAFGIDVLLEKIEGMFAFALFDQKEKRIYLARDKFGEKPLYYISTPKQFTFSSELKSLEDFTLPKKINLEGLNLFLSLSYIPAPFTIYEGVHKLEAGHYLELNLDGSFKKVKYYDLLERIKNHSQINDFGKAKNQLKSLLYQSVQQRTVSDVPLGSFLSGGLDSSIVSAVLADISDQPIETFTIGFKEKSHDESDRARIVVEKIKANATVQVLNYQDIVGIVDELILHFDEPFGDSSAIPSFLVAKLAKEKVTVVLTGDGADELFGGYQKYLANFYASKINQHPPIFKKLLKGIVRMIPHTPLTNSFLRKSKKVLKNTGSSGFDLHYDLMCMGFSDDERQALLQSAFFNNIQPLIKNRYISYSQGNDIEKGFYTDLRFVLEGDMLTKLDRMCMKNSLEGRFPFLDSKIVEFAFSLPLEFKIKKNNQKYILKETFRHLLPNKTINFSKKGFEVPVDLWLKNELKTEITTLVNKDFIEKQGIFNYELVKKLLQEHWSGKENHKGKLWNLYVFQKWYIKNFQTNEMIQCALKETQ